MPRIGFHPSIRRGWVAGLERAHELGAETLQIFSVPPSLWREAVLSESEEAQFHQLREQWNLKPLIVHTPFLPNLATRHPRIFARSVRALKEDLAWSRRLKADYLVIHPGAFSPGAEPSDGITRMGHALRDALAESERTTLLIENMAGGARRLGSTWDELARMLEAAGNSDRLGICLDTAHLWGAGYPFQTVKEVEATLLSLDRAIGLARVRVVHANDSSAEKGSHLDLHEHIGQGYLGLEPFRALLNDPRLNHAAFILETPRHAPEDDEENLRILKALSENF